MQSLAVATALGDSAQIATYWGVSGMLGLLAVLLLIVTAGMAGFFVAGVFWLMPSRRHRAKRVRNISLVMALGGGIAFTGLAFKEQTERANAAGFQSATDMRLAEEEGITDGTA